MIGKTNKKNKRHEEGKERKKEAKPKPKQTKRAKKPPNRRTKKQSGKELKGKKAEAVGCIYSKDEEKTKPNKKLDDRKNWTTEKIK